MKFIVCLFFIGLTISLSAETVDAYKVWQEGSPEKAMGILVEQAKEEKSWSLWFDAGLAAKDSGNIGMATACFVNAHSLAPEKTEPVEALESIDVVVPKSFVQELGPFAISRVIILFLLIFSGVGIAYVFSYKKRRVTVAIVSVLFLLLSSVVVVAHVIDNDRLLSATINPTHLFDSKNESIAKVSEGTVLVIVNSKSWTKRLSVSLPNGTSGYIPMADCELSVVSIDEE